MELYILSKEDLSILSVCKLADYEINLDEETNAKSTFTLMKVNGLKKGNFMVLNGLYKQFLFIIDEINTEKGSGVATVTALDISNIFDRKVIEKNINTMKNKSIEEFIANTISENFVNSDDIALNVGYIDTYWHTNTKSSVDTNAENGLYNFHTFLTNCRQYKNIYSDFKVENIGKPQALKGKELTVQARNRKVLDISLHGETSQATRSGKNKLPYNYYDSNSKTINGITFTVNKDRSITANGTATANAQFSITNPDNYAIVAGSYKLVGENNAYTKKAIRGSYKKADGTIRYISSDSSFTIPEGATNVHLYVVILQGETVNNVTFYPMLLNLTETDLTFEAGGASPSPDYPSEVENVEGNVNIQITGKNLFDEEVKIDNKGLAWATGELFNEAGSVSSDFILARDISQIYSNYKFHIYFYDKDKNYLGNSYNLTTGNGVVYDNLILPNNTDIAYFRLWFRKIINDSTDMTIKTDIMITRTQEELTDYEPYKSQTVTFPLVEGQKLMEGSYLADDGIHHKRGQIVLDGTENWGKLWPDSDAKNIFFFEINVEYVMDKNFVGIISNQYVGVNYGGNDGKSLWNLRINDNYKYLIAISYYFTNDNKRLAIKDIDCTTAQEFKAKLAEQYAKGTPVVVEYELAEEEIVPYTEAQQEAWDKLQNLMLYEGINHISSNANMVLSYYPLNPIGIKLILRIDIENKVEETKLIDTTLPEVTDYNKIYEEDVTAKVQVYIREDGSEYNLYLKTDRTTTTNKDDPNRLSGKIEVISVDTADKAAEEALNVMKGNRYKHLVEFKIAKTSRLMDITQLYIRKTS